MCTSARGSLKCSLIHKHTVQGETSDELFRFFPLPQKIKEGVFGGWAIERLSKCKRGRKEERRREGQMGVVRERVGVLQGRGVMQVKLCQCEAITADVRNSNNLPNFPSGKL